MINGTVTTNNITSPLEEAFIKGILFNCEEELIDKAWDLIKDGENIQAVLDAALKVGAHQHLNNEYMNSYLKAIASFIN